MTTERLVLRRPAPEDAERIFRRYSSDPEVTRYLSWRRHESLDATRAFLHFSDAEWQRWPAGPYLIETPTGTVLGSTGFAFEAPDEAATGYALARDAWGQGYATEALRAVVRIGRALGLRLLTAQCHPAHEASQRVLQKCGFTEARLRNRAEFPNLAPGAPLEVLSYTCEL